MFLEKFKDKAETLNNVARRRQRAKLKTKLKVTWKDVTVADQLSFSQFFKFCS